MRHLLVLVDSARPDPYLNGLVTSLRSEPPEAVTFVHVHGWPGAGGAVSPSGMAKRIMTEVLHGMSSLARDARYVDADGSTVALDEVNGSATAEEVRAFYGSVDDLGIVYASQEVAYGALRTYLRRLRRGGDELLVDVTGCRKRFIGDLIALGLVDGFAAIRTFDVLRPIDFERPWLSLPHELARGRDRTFDYVDLQETRIMIECSRAVFVRAPQVRHAFAVAVGLVCVGLLLNWIFGLDSTVAKWVNVAAQFATFAALVFVFFPPRNS